MAAIRFENITHCYGTKKVLDGLSLEIAAGRVTCLLGGTGSGKTTLLRLAAGLEVPLEGKVYLSDILATDGERVLIPPSQRKIGFVFQDLALWPHFTVLKNVGWVCKINGQVDWKNKAKDILDELGLAEHLDQYPHQLSGGQQQLLAIARALASAPTVLLMDEPLSGLDMRLKAEVMKYIQKVKAQFDITIVYVTHNHHEAFQLADEIVVLSDHGKIEEVGNVRDIRASENAFVRDFIRGAYLSGIGPV